MGGPEVAVETFKVTPWGSPGTGKEGSHPLFQPTSLLSPTHFTLLVHNTRFATINTTHLQKAADGLGEEENFCCGTFSFFFFFEFSFFSDPRSQAAYQGPRHGVLPYFLEIGFRIPEPGLGLPPTLY